MLGRMLWARFRTGLSAHNSLQWREIPAKGLPRAGSSLACGQAIGQSGEYTDGNRGDPGMLSVGDHLTFGPQCRFHGTNNLLGGQHPLFNERQHQTFNEHDRRLTVGEVNNLLRRAVINGRDILGPLRYLVAVHFGLPPTLILRRPAYAGS